MKKLIDLVATWFGLGLLPRAPGTFGTLGAIPLAWLLADPLAHALATAAVTLAGTFAAEAYVRASGREDDQRIVVDEVAGYLVTLSLVPPSPLNLALGFVLFRIFDMWKPPPIGWLDRTVKGGLGVMVDDLAAGVYAAAILFLIAH